MPEGEAQDQAAGGAGGATEEKPRTYSQDQLEAVVKDRITRLKKKAKAEAADELLTDETFRSKALEAWKVKPDGGAKPDPMSEDKVRELYGAWEQKHVAPLNQEVQSLRSEVERARMDRLEADIIAAGSSAGVAKGMLKKQANQRSALFNVVLGSMAWDDEHSEWRVRADEGFRPSPDGKKLYMDPQEFVKDVWAADPDNAALITDRTQQGAGYSGSQASGGKRIYSRDEFKKLVSDQDFYEKHRDELLSAEREGRVR